MTYLDPTLVNEVTATDPQSPQEMYTVIESKVLFIPGDRSDDETEQKRDKERENVMNITRETKKSDAKR